MFALFRWASRMRKLNLNNSCLNLRMLGDMENCGAYLSFSPFFTGIYVPLVLTSLLNAF